MVRELSVWTSHVSDWIVGRGTELRGRKQKESEGSGVWEGGGVAKFFMFMPFLGSDFGKLLARWRSTVTLVSNNHSRRGRSRGRKLWLGWQSLRDHQWWRNVLPLQGIANWSEDYKPLCHETKTLRDKSLHMGILRLRNPNSGPNSGKRILDARILDPNSWVEFFDTVFSSKEAPRRIHGSRNSPPKFTLQNSTQKSDEKNLIAPLPGHLAEKPQMKQHCCCTRWGHPWLAISGVVAAEDLPKDGVVSCRVCFVSGEIVDPKPMKDREAVVCVFFFFGGHDLGIRCQCQCQV